VYTLCQIPRTQDELGLPAIARAPIVTASIATAIVVTAAAPFEAPFSARAATTLVACFVYLEAPTAEFSSVESADRSICSILIHLYESKPTWPARLAICNEINGMHGTILGEEVPYFLFARPERQVAYENVLHDCHQNFALSTAPQS